jgi:hypothetical protein
MRTRFLAFGLMAPSGHIRLGVLGQSKKSSPRPGLWKTSRSFTSLVKIVAKMAYLAKQLFSLFCPLRILLVEKLCIVWGVLAFDSLNFLLLVSPHLGRIPPRVFEAFLILARVLIQCTNEGRVLAASNPIGQT